MTRRELAIFLREQAYALTLPLEDGTTLGKGEAEQINVAMDKLRLVAESVEIGNAADANALRAQGIEANAD